MGGISFGGKFFGGYFFPSSHLGAPFSLSGIKARLAWPPPKSDFHRRRRKLAVGLVFVLPSFFLLSSFFLSSFFLPSFFFFSSFFFLFPFSFSLLPSSSDKFLQLPRSGASRLFKMIDPSVKATVASSSNQQLITRAVLVIQKG